MILVVPNANLDIDFFQREYANKEKLKAAKDTWMMEVVKFALRHCIGYKMDFVSQLAALK